MGINESDEDLDDDDFKAEDEPDDETTLTAEENKSRDMDIEDELSLLKAESEIPIEQLRETCGGDVSDDKDDMRVELDSDDNNAMSRESGSDNIQVKYNC